jgi:hypothetical protein
MKARVSILQIKEYLGSIRYANCTRESDDWHFTADFYDAKRGFIAGDYEALNSEFCQQSKN